MRIIAGKHRGLTLASLGKGDSAAHLRPTPDRVRESLFNILGHHDVIDGAVVLDLFAGTGALGLEALSRGAARAIFVDNGPKSHSLLSRNIALSREEGATTIIRRDATRLGPAASAGAGAAGLVFLDPPYGKNLGAAALLAAQSGGWIAPGALIVWEEAKPQFPPDADFTLLDQRRYGDTHITLLAAPGAP